MTMKGIPFPKVPGSEPHHQMQFSVILKTLMVGVGSDGFAEMQLEYSAAPTNRSAVSFYLFFLKKKKKQKKKTKNIWYIFYN